MTTLRCFSRITDICSNTAFPQQKEGSTLKTSHFTLPWGVPVFGGKAFWSEKLIYQELSIKWLCVSGLKQLSSGLHIHTLRSLRPPLTSFLGLSKINIHPQCEDPGSDNGPHTFNSTRSHLVHDKNPPSYLIKVQNVWRFGTLIIAGNDE